MSLADELEEAAGQLQRQVRSRLERLKRAGRRPRPMSKVRPRKKRRIGLALGLRPAPLFKPMQVNVTPGKGPPTTATR